MVSVDDFITGTGRSFRGFSIPPTMNLHRGDMSPQLRLYHHLFRMIIPNSYLLLKSLNYETHYIWQFTFLTYANLYISVAPATKIGNIFRQISWII